MKKFLSFSRPVPRWVILLIDLVITVFSFTLSYFIVKQFQFSAILRGHFFVYTTLYSLISLPVFYCMRIHTGMLRFSNVYDMMRISLAVLITGVLFPLAVVFVVNREYHINSLNIPGVLLINFFISCTLHMMLRSMVRAFYYYVKHNAIVLKENVLIYGSDSEAMCVKQAIESSITNKFVIAGFVETDINKANVTIQQKRVYHIRELPLLKTKKKIDKLILMNEQLDSRDKKVVIEKCLQFGIKVLTVPPSDQWTYGKLSLKQIQELRIEDLLQREPIIINNEKISSELTGKRILITGAAGSIGSEIVRQALSFDPEMVVLCDQAESPLHEMQLEMEEKFPGANIKIFIGNIRDRNRMQIPFREYRPHFVFHAAAYKHVPMMERHPSEAILTNVMGTKIIADLSVLYNVHKFVMISTDKAVNPTNVMGTSKRIAEMYVQSLSSVADNLVDQTIMGLINGDSKAGVNANGRTKFITTRFGNVLGSNGSVIPRFRQQIQNGGPVTVTHPEITRYFMTIPEAVQLVMEAAIMGKGAEIFVFDMGKPVKIVDLALKMIRLAGLTPDEDIKIVYSGLRPGEKLYEELLNEQEKTLPTHHEKIKIAKIIPCSHKVVREIEELISMSRLEDNYGIVKKMKELVPEFKSKNSQYEKLDLQLNKAYTAAAD
ncbi:polysaccharide biosynthesis protein [Niastella vici]|uniref:Polysaccharide biosynthesis protein n=1 Tax=Niastella vici TaxID=1703345 RepID=A0A1V9G1C0_9BACT|nr:nucleoside-diphosphate sugar epimerase/dehydratase [Niastella vici]OQP64382.1 polysaccharide biosynthesis protein [Niastella vici]